MEAGDVLGGLRRGLDVVGGGGHRGANVAEVGAHDVRLATVADGADDDGPDVHGVVTVVSEREAYA